MSRVSTATPLWVKLTIAALGATFLVWWVVQRADRVANEHRLGAIASQIAGRDVEVHCPGAVWRAIGYDSAGGAVQFDANMKPADETRLSAASASSSSQLAAESRVSAAGLMFASNWTAPLALS